MRFILIGKDFKRVSESLSFSCTEWHEGLEDLCIDEFTVDEFVEKSSIDFTFDWVYMSDKCEVFDYSFSIKGKYVIVNCDKLDHKDLDKAYIENSKEYDENVVYVVKELVRYTTDNCEIDSSILITTRDCYEALEECEKAKKYWEKECHEKFVEKSCFEGLLFTSLDDEGDGVEITIQKWRV